MAEKRKLNCEICSVLVLEEPGIIETTEYFRVCLARDQLYLGRAYLTLLRHEESFGGLTKSEQLDWFGAFSRYESAVKGVFGAVHLTESTLMNNAYREAPPSPHVHTHLRPRYKFPVKIGEDIFNDPNFGDHHLRGEGSIRVVNDGVLGKISELIREQY